MKITEGKLNANGMSFAIVVSRFNSLISQQLLAGALDSLKRHGADDNNVNVFWTPGAFEIPLTAQRIAGSKKYDAVITLGAVIRGNTPHFDYVAAEVSKGVAAVSLNTSVPVIFGVLTTETTEQALERAGVKAGNKGAEAALTAIEMVDLLRQVG